MEKFTEYCLEQSQKNATNMFDVMKHSVTNSVELLNWAQGEAQQMYSRLTEQGLEQFVTQLEKIQDQQLTAQQEFQGQFRTLLSVFQQEGK